MVIIIWQYREIIGIGMIMKWLIDVIVNMVDVNNREGVVIIMVIMIIMMIITLIMI